LHDQPEVWIRFSRHSPNWRVVENFLLSSQETTGPIYRNCQWEGKKNLARLVSGFVFLLANSELYLHLSSWRVVIRIPGSTSNVVRDPFRDQTAWHTVHAHAGFFVFFSFGNSQLLTGRYV
jgi:hypothetical protein